MRVIEPRRSYKRVFRLWHTGDRACFFLSLTSPGRILWRTIPYDSPLGQRLLTTVNAPQVWGRG